MNKTIALINQDGSVAFTHETQLTPVDTTYLQSTGLRQQEAPDGVLAPELIQRWFYRDGWIETPPKPSYFHVLNMTTLVWEDHRTLQDFKEAQWALIKQAREAAINAPLVTPYGTFDSDPKSRQNITDAILMLKSLEDLGTPTTIDFTLADDTTRTLTTGEMIMVGLLLGQKTQVAHAQSRALRGALDLATTKEEVEAITWQATT